MNVALGVFLSLGQWIMCSHGGSLKSDTLIHTPFSSVQLLIPLYIWFISVLFYSVNVPSTKICTLIHWFVVSLPGHVFKGIGHPNANPHVIPNPLLSFFCQTQLFCKCLGFFFPHERMGMNTFELKKHCKVSYK